MNLEGLEFDGFDLYENSMKAVLTEDDMLMSDVGTHSSRNHHEDQTETTTFQLDNHHRQAQDDRQYHCFSFHESQQTDLFLNGVDEADYRQRDDSSSSATTVDSEMGGSNIATASEGQQQFKCEKLEIRETEGIATAVSQNYYCENNYNTSSNVDDTTREIQNNYYSNSNASRSTRRNNNCTSDESLAEMESKHLWSTLLDGVVLRDDPMMSDACRSQPKTDHCYSSVEELKSKHTKSSTTGMVKSVVMTKTYRDTKRSNGSVVLQAVKQEPKIITVHTTNHVDSKVNIRPAQSLLRPSGTQSLMKSSGVGKLVYPVAKIKSEPKAPSDEDAYAVSNMPITPPSSNQSSDSEGGTSPRPTPPASPVRHVLVARASGYKYNPATALYSQPIPTSGVLRLTEEEKRTFITEGYPLPSKLPLSKFEERNLKKVRRKIKNKISAQESRRKKKEYMDQLERRVEDIVKENNSLRQKCDDYETNNRSLVTKLRKLQAVLKGLGPRQVTAQTGTCLLVMVLCFAVFLGNWDPFSSTFTSQASNVFHSSLHGAHSHISQVRGSRTLTSLADGPESYNTPWPIRVAQYTLKWTAHLICDNSSIPRSLCPQTLSED